MSKALRDLQEQILQKSAVARKLLEGPEKDVEKAQAILDEVNQLQAEVAARKQLDDLERHMCPLPEPHRRRILKPPKLWTPRRHF